MVTKPVGEQLLGAFGGNFVSGAIVKTIRSVLNNSIKDIRPGQVLTAIETNASIWGLAGTDITQIAGRIPPAFINAGRPMYLKAVKECGTATDLVLAWLKEDNPMLFSMIINTEGGIAWFDHQVREMTTNLGLEYS